jgi:hypothetical protein
MMNALPRFVSLLSALLLVAGCATRSGEQPDPALVRLGEVSTGGPGIAPSYAAVQFTLRNQAAQQYGVPVEEIVLGPIDIAGGTTMTTQSQEYVSAGVATVALPTDHRGLGSWQATAEVARRAPKLGDSLK